MLNLLRPKALLDEHDVRHGLRMLLFDGVYSQLMGSLVTGAFLVAFALKLGASNSVVGLLAAIGPLTQAIQIPAIFLVNRLRLRKSLTVFSSTLSRLFLIPAALSPFLLSPPWQIPILLLSLFMFFGMMAISSCAFNSWVRDLVPQQIFGQFFARRMGWAITAGAVLSLAAGIGVDYYEQHINDGPEIYTLLFLIGAVAGFIGVTYLVRTPEPQMEPPEQQRILQVLREPFADANFRKLLIFLGSWNFAVNIATPFGAVYMLERLDMRLTWVLVLVVFGQIIHVIFLRIWGRLSDRYSNKSVLTISGPLFMLSLLVWPFTTMPEAYALTMPLLVFAHALGGMSTAGVALASSNIALKIAPYGRATAYLAVNALVCGMAMTVSPIIAGIAADMLVQRELSLTLQFSDLAAQAPEFSVVALNLRGLDFLFFSAAILGLYAIHRLLVVHEEGEAQESVVVEELWNEVRKFGRSVSTVPGLRNFSHFPYYLLSAVSENARRSRDKRHEEYRKPSNPFRGLG